MVRIDELEPASQLSLPSAWLARQGTPGPWRRARVTLSFPLANIGVNLPTLAATVAGNLYDLGEVTDIHISLNAITRTEKICMNDIGVQQHTLRVRIANTGAELTIGGHRIPIWISLLGCLGPATLAGLFWWTRR